MRAFSVPSGARQCAASELQFDAAELQRLELELARFVGPLTKHHVKRAASQASGVKELVR